MAGPGNEPRHSSSSVPTSKPQTHFLPSPEESSDPRLFVPHSGGTHRLSLSCPHPFHCPGAVAPKFRAGRASRVRLRMHMRAHAHTHMHPHTFLSLEMGDSLLGSAGNILPWLWPLVSGSSAALPAWPPGPFRDRVIIDCRGPDPGRGPRGAQARGPPFRVFWKESETQKSPGGSHCIRAASYLLPPTPPSPRRGHPASLEFLCLLS